MLSTLRGIALGVLVVVTALFATCCGSSLSSEHRSGWVSSSAGTRHRGPISQDRARPFFAAAGLAVSAVPAPDPYVGLSTLAGGGADIAFGSATSMVEMAYQGLDIRVLAEAG
ncbi:hypothetical protein [Amycolatopsis lurida]|uniref:hypothetical protein n=1 Tax=Amycolatopsis lurida TaxID=31959 RepID=UPI003648BEBB